MSGTARQEWQSLRRKLLLWLLPPLLGLIALDTTILYRFAQGFVHEQFDHALYESAHDVLQAISKSGRGGQALDLPQQVRDVILSDPYDHIFYSIVDAQGRTISGEPELAPPAPPGDGEAVPRFFDATVRSKAVRAASLSAAVDLGSGPQWLRIQLAQTLHRRIRLDERILTGIIVQQLLVVLLAAALVGYGIGRGLSPLRQLQAALGRRSHRDLSPIRLPGIPQEVRTLVEAVNSLMQQLGGVLEAQNRFIADAAHQLRTPIAGIQAQLALALGDGDPEQTRASLTQASAGVQRLGHLVNQLLSLARNQPEVARAIAMRRTDLCTLAQAAATEMVPTAYRKAIDLGFEAEGGPAFVEGEPQRLAELLENLLDNAVRYTPRGGKITVGVAADDGRVVLSVEDDGPGIAPEEAEQVFERFHRVIGSGEEGSGLGLAIVREIAHLHRAEVRIGTPPGGHGTRVQVRFPPAA